MDDYLPRLADALLDRQTADFPAVMINGPRACGKTTSARRRAAAVVRLDVPGEAALFRSDPDAGLAAFSGRPLLLDEWQEVPELIGAVKRAVDAGAPAGSFVLTGSVQAPLDAGTWPGTGRLALVEFGPISVREQLRRVDRVGLISRILSNDLRLGAYPAAPDVIEYVDIALAGGFPDAVLKLPDRSRSDWYASYVDQVARRDVRAILARADPDRVRRYLEAYALNSAGAANHATIFTAAGVSRKTAESYDDVLGRLYLTSTVPAWATNRLSGLTKLPKRYVSDTAMMAACARLSRDDVLRDGDLLGRLVDTFVHAQLRAEIAAEHPSVRISHVRTANSRQEIDLVLELGGRRVVGIEVKAGSTVTRDDARHLIWLRDRLGDDFVAGIVLHTGASAFSVDDRVSALPICALWNE